MARKDKEMKDDKCCRGHWHHHAKCGGAVYGLGFIGAAIFYIQQSTGFWMGVLGILKALVWPAFLVHGLLKFIGI